MFRKKSILIFLSAALVVSQSVDEESTLDVFLDEKASETKDFFQNQIDRVRQVVKSTYAGVDDNKFRYYLSNYLKEQEKKLAADVSGYVEYLKTGDKKSAEIWSSFLPTIDPDARMDNPDSKLTVPAIITRNGYICETHTVTSDGYILNIHRIPRPRNGVYTSRDAVILFHGLLDSSYGWIINGPEKSLGYVLADAGYDVWILNGRGNYHSREHAWYKTDSKEFWNFSFHEQALQDVPTIIDYIHKIKGNNTKIAYVGHSMGTTILFSMLSFRPDYNEKLSVGVALAPAVYLSNMKFPWKRYKDYVTSLAKTAMMHHSYEVFRQDFFEIVSKSCRDLNREISIVCQNMMFESVGEDRDQLNVTTMSNFLSKASSTSWKNIFHFFQIMNSGEFRQFDYGNAEFNKLMYGSKTSPEYDLSKVRLNITLFWAQNDALVHEKDVFTLHEKLPKTTKTYMVPYPKFNHADFLWAKEAPRLVNDKVLEILQEAMARNYVDFI